MMGENTKKCKKDDIFFLIFILNFWIKNKKIEII